MPNPKSEESVFQLKVTLNHSKPPIWRRIELIGKTKLSDFHEILQLTMGWTNSHLHQFDAGGVCYGEPHPDFGFEVIDEETIALSQLVIKEGDRFIYQYDFGDGWEHELLLEKILAIDARARYPRCVKGKRRCPPEDIGGVWGYDYFLEAIQDKKHPEHAHYKEWVDDSFDPEEFNIDEVNEMLEHYF
ncbi:MAG: plasmid pRiA4b ORF-3 family protein [Rhodothermales bacterium]